MGWARSKEACDVPNNPRHGAWRWMDSRVALRGARRPGVVLGSIYGIRRAV